MSVSVGALVITRNEEAVLADCLDSLAFCDERVVVDSFSEDATVEIACARAEHVYQREFVHHADQKNWGMAQLRTDWVLIVDADERVPAELAAEIGGLVRSEAIDGYWIRRSNSFFGREIRGAGWNRDRVLRLMRRGRGRYPDRALHEEIELDDPARVGECTARLRHDSYRDWPGSFGRLLSYSTRGAHERRRRGRRAGVGDLVVRPTARFVQQYVLRAGFRDGAHGVALCAWSAAGIFLREAKLMRGETEVAIIGGNPDGTPRVERIQGRAPTVDPVTTAPDGTGSEEER